MRSGHSIGGKRFNECVCRVFEGRNGAWDCIAITHISTLNERIHISRSIPLCPSRHDSCILDMSI